MDELQKLLKLNNWKGLRVYVTVPSKRTGAIEVGYYDIATGEFVEKANKGMVQWLGFQTGLNAFQVTQGIIALCQQA